MPTAVLERVAPVSSNAVPRDVPLSFTLSRGDGPAIVVYEAKGRAGGLFTELSSAMRFVEIQCRSYKCPVDMRFDASLALIRAAG
jgi:hypothetical protein